MKCKKCGHEMKREKARDHAFIYRCTKCGAVIRRNKAENSGEAER